MIINKIFSVILAIIVIFSLNFGTAKAGGVVEAVVEVVVDVVDVVVDIAVGVVDAAIDIVDTITEPIIGVPLASAALNFTVGVIEYVSGAILDVVGLDSVAKALYDDGSCRFDNFNKDIDLGDLVDPCLKEETPSSQTTPVLPPSDVKLETWVIGGSSQPLCNSITLSGINAEGHNYAIVRDGKIIKELSASETGYTDTGLTPHTNYEYKIRIPYPEESGFLTSDSAPIAAYTKCFPQCGFGATEKSVAQYGKATLVWNCNYNNPTIDKGSCQIEDTATGEKHSISATSGILEIPVTADSTFVLSCANIDGAINIPQSIKVFEPGIKEIKP
jgi:hypothetical protein